MIEENARSRIFLGVHWVFDAFAVNENDLTQNIGGVKLGIDVADDIATHVLTAAAAAGSGEGGWRSLKCSPQRDRVGQRADAFDGDRDALPGVQWADAGGGAGEDHVTG